MEYEKRLYLVLHPNLALVGSQLDPVHFADHYTSGSSRYHSGKVIFAEIDSGFRHPFFPIDETMKELVPHEEDGRPKATKFIASYRVLEHMELDAIISLHLVTAEGDLLTIPPQNAKCPEGGSGQIHIYAEIAPLRMLVMSDYNVHEFGEFITSPNNPKGAPALFFTQIDLDVEDFVSQFEKHPFKESPIKTIHPSTLRDAYRELKSYPDKHNKGLCLDSSIDQSSYKYVRQGFNFASKGKIKCFSMPSLKDIERNNYKFWKHM
ncbi:MAG: hypothetical protein ACLFSA_08270 [Spirochaetaceae bacterium]